MLHAREKDLITFQITTDQSLAQTMHFLYWGPHTQKKKRQQQQHKREQALQSRNKAETNKTIKNEKHENRRLPHPPDRTSNCAKGAARCRQAPPLLPVARRRARARQLLVNWYWVFCAVPVYNVGAHRCSRQHFVVSSRSKSSSARTHPVFSPRGYIQFFFPFAVHFFSRCLFVFRAVAATEQ